MDKYQSPIQIAFGKMETKIENDVLKAVYKYNILVDAEELKKALKYDRHQYDEGYSDGRKDTAKEIINYLLLRLGNKESTYTLAFDNIEEIAEKYGIEVEEDGNNENEN